MSLFEKSESANLDRAKPLASRMRPRNLDEFIGQQHILGEDKLLRRLLKADRLGSIILFGPPGVGKTTLARILADQTSRRFRQLSAIMHGVKDLREVWPRLEITSPLVRVGPSCSSMRFTDSIRLNRMQCWPTSKMVW